MKVITRMRVNWLKHREKWPNPIDMYIFGNIQTSKLTIYLYRRISLSKRRNSFNFRDTFNVKLCQELNMPPTVHSVRQILEVVNEWNVHKVLKSRYKGIVKKVCRKQKEIQ